MCSDTLFIENLCVPSPVRKLYFLSSSKSIRCRTSSSSTGEKEEGKEDSPKRFLYLSFATS